jgi:transposase
MSIPGVGVITATSFVTAIEDPSNFKTSRSVAAWSGLTTRRYQSGEIDYDGHIYPGAGIDICEGFSTKLRRSS